MILRFKVNDDEVYLAINTDTESYTQGPAAAADFEIGQIDSKTYLYILKELDFNDWRAVDDINQQAEESELPWF